MDSTVWTESLQDHLSLSIEDTEKELRLFHVASFLHGYKKCKDRYEPPPLSYPYSPTTDVSQDYPFTRFPQRNCPHIITLDPVINLKCQRWIRKVRRKDDVDLEAAYLLPTPWELADFPYWGRQLMELRDEYERTEPTTMRQ